MVTVNVNHTKYFQLHARINLSQTILKSIINILSICVKHRISYIIMLV